MDKEKLIDILRIVLIAVLAIGAVLGYDIGVVQPRVEQQNVAIAALSAEVSALSTASAASVGTRGTIERAGVLDTNGDGITGWNGSDVSIYTDNGSTPSFTVDGATGNTWTLGSLTFEGATADADETTFAITDPTEDRTITVPNSSGTIALNPYGASIEFEGDTADVYEGTLAVVDPTADRTYTIPNETGAIMMSSLATNGTAITNSVTGGTNSLIWEGATADAYEMTVTATDPTAARSVVLPDAGGTVMLSSLATNGPDAANGVWGASNGLVFEGATGGADAFETTLTVTDPTADNTVTIPDASGTVMLSSLATNGVDAANAVTGASNGLVWEGATANDYETTIAATDPTADRTVTLQDATGTVALTSQAVDMTLTADSSGGNAGAKTEFIGLPRIKLIGGGQGTNPGSQTIALLDDSPEGEFAPVDASVTEAAETAIYKYGAGSYEAAFAVDAAATDGFIDAGLGANASWEDMESVGLLVYSTATWAAGDLTLVLTDDGGAQTFDIPALTATNAWTWLEVDISALAAGTGDVISDVAVLMSAQGETALGAFTMYLDVAYVWDSADEEALGVAIQQDGVLGVINTESGASLVELTDYLVHYETGSDFIVYITDQSTADIAVLAAY